MDNEQPVLYVELIKALYGLQKAEILFYKKVVKGLKEIGFKFNAYDPCVANIIANDKETQHCVAC